jgi:hypothetical protein
MLLFADLSHEQRLGLLDALLKDNDLHKFALLSTQSPAFGLDVLEMFMEALQVCITRLSSCFFTPLPVNELSQVRCGHIVSDASSARRGAELLPRSSNINLQLPNRVRCCRLTSIAGRSARLQTDHASPTKTSVSSQWGDLTAHHY